MEEIKESGYNEFYRTIVSFAMKAMFYLGIFFSLFFVPVIFQEKSLIAILVYFVITMIILLTGYFLKNRIVRIKGVNRAKIIIAEGKRETEVVIEDIYSITRLDLYPIGGRMRVLLRFYCKNKKKKDWVIFMDEPGYHLMDQFQNMGIKSKALF